MALVYELKYSLSRNVLLIQLDNHALWFPHLLCITLSYRSESQNIATLGQISFLLLSHFISFFLEKESYYVTLTSLELSL